MLIYKCIVNVGSNLSSSRWKIIFYMDFELQYIRSEKKICTKQQIRNIPHLTKFAELFCSDFFCFWFRGFVELFLWFQHLHIFYRVNNKILFLFWLNIYILNTKHNIKQSVSKFWCYNIWRNIGYFPIRLMFGNVSIMKKKEHRFFCCWKKVIDKKYMNISERLIMG